MIKVNEFHTDQDVNDVLRVGRFLIKGQFINPKQQLVLEQIHHFFTDDILHNTLLQFLEKEKGGYNVVSKRDMDWLVTNYSKKYNVQYEWQIKQGWPKDLVCLHESYHTYLRQYRRGMFDIFCRGQRVYFNLDDKIYDTTVGQLHFLKWAKEYGVIDFLIQNYEKISSDHRRRQAQAREEKKKFVGVKRKRQELSQAHPPVCDFVNTNIELRWI